MFAHITISMQTYIVPTDEKSKWEPHILKELQKFSNYSVFIQNGETKDLTSYVFDKYFWGDTMCRAYPATARAYKHLLAYRAIVANGDPLALVLEDDMHLSRNFYKKLNAAVHEIQQRKLSRYIVSLDSPTDVTGGDLLLRELSKEMAAGAYLIDLSGAQHLLYKCEEIKMDVPLEAFLQYCVQTGVIHQYGLEKVIASKVQNTFQKMVLWFR